MKIRMKSVIICIGIVGLLGVIISVPLGVEALSVPDKPSHFFGKGDIVKMKIDGRRGMVVGRYKYYKKYRIRFANQQMTTTTHLLSADGPIRAVQYSIVDVCEYELERE